MTKKLDIAIISKVTIIKNIPDRDICPNKEDNHVTTIIPIFDFLNIAIN